MGSKDKPDPRTDFSCARLTGQMVAAGEDPREFKELYDQVYAEWQPHTFTEWIYFKRILSAYWNFKRIDRMENELLAAVGRFVWERQILLAVDETLPPELQKVRAGMTNVDKMREMSMKSLAAGQRELKRYQKDLRRERKTAAAEAKSRAARNLADLEPGSNLIQ